MTGASQTGGRREAQAPTSTAECRVLPAGPDRARRLWQSQVMILAFDGGLELDTALF
jgi:hypothetical protein